MKLWSLVSAIALLVSLVCASAHGRLVRPAPGWPGDLGTQQLCSPYPAASDRFGIGVNNAWGLVTDLDVAQLGAGWYVDWQVKQQPPHPAGLDYVQMVHVSGDRFTPSEGVLASIVSANPGATWLIGNEPDCIWQGNSTPEQYARVYHWLYGFLKARDPSCRVTVGGIVQVTPLRLQWLEAVLESYRLRYGAQLPVDLWNIHTFILREERASWGCDIPPGLQVSRGELWEVEDHDRMDLFAQQVLRFRQWMRDRGQRDKELIVSEYGILMSEDLGFDASRVRAFMRRTFDYFMTAVDPELGCPTDGNRLVQRWAWYSLNDKGFEGYPSYGHLFDPVTKEITALGSDFADYVRPLHGSYTDLIPLGVAASPPVPPTPNGQPVTITLTAWVRNAGNADVEDEVVVSFWRDVPTQALGQKQVFAPLMARSAIAVSIEWHDVAPGTYRVGVTVDASDQVPEACEDNNHLVYTLLVPEHARFLPLARKWIAPLP